MEADPHPQQPARLRALYSYEILDTDREQEFDDVVKLASEICGTAISVINLIDAERQWFKAEVGLGVRETPIATSICSHVVLQNEFVEIRDTLDDPRMADNPFCCGDPGLRFYAGALLTSDDGLPIGTLCVLDWQPRRLTALQRDAIRVLARQVMAQLDLRRALRNAQALRQEVDHRVKNSLQLLSSLAGLQALSTPSDEARDALSAMQGRIQAISMLHEQLYRTDAGPRIELADYVANLASSLNEIAPEGVGIETDLESVIVDSREAAAAGTLLNEWASNAFKHAFPDHQAGRVRITLRRCDDGLVTLACSDDGVGLPDDVDKLGTGLGLKIGQAICNQLSGELGIERTPPGVSFRLAFMPQR